MKHIQIKLASMAAFGRWQVRGPVIGTVDGKEVQTLEEVVFAFSFFRIIWRPKNRYAFY